MTFPTEHDLLKMWVDNLNYANSDNYHSKEFKNRMALWDKTYKAAGRNKERDVQGWFHQLLAENNRTWAKIN